MTEYNKISEGSFTYTGAANFSYFLSLPYVPNSIELWNLTTWGTTSNVQRAVGFASQAAGTAYIETGAAGPVLAPSTVTTQGFSFISAGTYMYGPVLTGTGVSQANPAVVTITAHGLVTGDSVLIYGVTGMQQISGQVYVVTVTGANTFTIPVNSSGFAAAGTAVMAKKLLYPDLYIPFNCDITAIATGTTTTITTAVNHRFVVGQEVSFVIPNQWGMTQLDYPIGDMYHGRRLRAYVTSVPSLNSVVVNINSTGFTPFAYPTSAVAAAGLTFPQIYAVGDANTGYQAVGNVVPLPQTIPGAFAANTRQGVLIGSNVLTPTSGTQVIEWRAFYPDQILTV